MMGRPENKLDESLGLCCKAGLEQLENDECLNVFQIDSEKKTVQNVTVVACKIAESIIGTHITNNEEKLEKPKERLELFKCIQQILGNSDDLSKKQKQCLKDMKDDFTETNEKMESTLNTLRGLLLKAKDVANISLPFSLQKVSNNGQNGILTIDLNKSSAPITKWFKYHFNQTTKVLKIEWTGNAACLEGRNTLPSSKITYTHEGRNEIARNSKSFVVVVFKRTNLKILSEGTGAGVDQKTPQTSEVPIVPPQDKEDEVEKAASELSEMIMKDEK